MIAKLKTLIPIALLALLISCKKDNSSSSSSSLIGNYKFISLSANITTTSTVVSGTEVDKSVTISRYTSKNNSGTIAFNATTISSNNVSYSIDTTISNSDYTNGVLTDSFDAPFQFVAPPSSSTSQYKMIGTDSISVSSGALIFNGSTQSTGPQGAKLTFNGNRLIMSTNLNQTTTQSSQGTLVNMVISGNTSITLEKM